MFPHCWGPHVLSNQLEGRAVQVVVDVVVVVLAGWAVRRRVDQEPADPKWRHLLQSGRNSGLNLDPRALSSQEAMPRHSLEVHGRSQEAGMLRLLAHL